MISDLLIVDDTPANLHLLADLLKQRGYKVRPVPSGELALQAATAYPPDLVLLDINMPNMNGFEVCERLKKDARLRDIPVIFISALDETLDKVKAFALGGVDYITKPFQFEEVLARVQTHLELRNRERQLKESFGQLQSLEQSRDNLVHMMVHDMRSQLTVISAGLGMVRVMCKEGRIPDGKLVADMTTSAHRLIEMITQVLDISRFEAGQMPLIRASCDVAQLAREAMDSLLSMVGGRELRLLAPGPVTVPCDLEVVRRILSNLLVNAFKYSPKNGQVTVVVRDESGMAHISVSDTGPGIPPELQQNIFNKFGQADVSHKRMGSGLGLAFCRLAVEAHGGRIGVESQSGQGSTFWFTLPGGGGPVAG
jgi:signal transduction histidine kinase